MMSETHKPQTPPRPEPSPVQPDRAGWIPGEDKRMTSDTMKLFLWLHGLAYLSFGAFIIFSGNGPIWTFAVVGTGLLFAAWYTELTRINERLR